MRKISFNPEITLGSLIQVVTIALGVASAWYVVVGRIASLEKDNEKTVRVIEKITMVNERIADSVYLLRENQARISVLLEERFNNKGKP